MTFKYTYKLNPNSWSDKPLKRIWVGHPAIARGIIRFLKWLSSRRNEQA